MGKAKELAWRRKSILYSAPAIRRTGGRGVRRTGGRLSMIQSTRPIDRDEVIYKALLLCSVAFSSLHAFMAIRDVWGHVSIFILKMADVLG